MLRPWHRTFVTLSILAVLAVLAAWPSVARAHGKGVLKLADRRLVAGGTVRVNGERFPKASSLVILLVGPAGRMRLGEVRTDTAGAFRAAPVVPADLPVGAYRLVVLASDGDEVGALDVELVPAAARDHEAGHAEGSPDPTARSLSLDRERDLRTTGGAVIGIVAALVAGGLLLRRPAAARPSQ